MSATTTKRVFRHLPARETAFMDVGPSAGMLLAQLPPEVERVFLVGPAPVNGWLSYALEGLGPWRPGRHYLEGQHPVLRYDLIADAQLSASSPNRVSAPEQKPAPGRRGVRTVALFHAESFFPGGGYDCRQAAEAWRTLAACIAGAFDGASLLDTPATTGRELMLRSIPKDVEWPVLSKEHQELIRSTSGQARIETLNPPFYNLTLGGRRHGEIEPEKLPALYEYDMRLAYAASAWELGAGIPTHDKYAEYMGQQRGRYLVDVVVPADWDRPFGLLGVKDGNDGWRYPSEPLEQFQTWCDGAELHVLMKHGWGGHCIIRERLLFPTYQSVGPLDLWRDRLVRIYNALGAFNRTKPDWPVSQIRQLARIGVRSIILHSIGALNATSHKVTRFSTSLDDVPQWVRSKVRFEGPYCLWPETTPATWEALQHPEWAAAIWARTRARLLDAPKKQGALNICGGVVAFSTDALYLTQRQPWTDDKTAGRFRLKRWGEGPFPWPANRNDVIRLRNSLPHSEVEA